MGRRALCADLICEGPGTVIGWCKLLEQIGEGGFGVVFMAEQLQPVRRPEQAEMSGLDTDTWTDITRWGVLLYELLTGATPFDRERLKIAVLLDSPLIVEPPGRIIGRPA